MRRYLATAVLALAVLPTVALAMVFTFLHPAPSGQDYLTDALPHQVPGPVANPALGVVVTDPVFGGHIHRITATGTGGTDSQIYAENGWWNADCTMFIQSHSIINPDTGAVIRSGIPVGLAAYMIQWSPVDPDVYYYVSGANLMQYKVSTSTSSIVHTFPGTLTHLGGSFDWVDNSGNYFVVGWANNVTVYSKSENIVFSPNIPIADPSALGEEISPDGHYIIYGANTRWDSYYLDLVNHTIGPAVRFDTISTGHHDTITASDGKTYMISEDVNYGNPNFYAFDVTRVNPTPQQQITLNRLLLQVTWQDDMHTTCVSRGAHRDWCIIDTENYHLNNQSLGNEIYWNEFVFVNALTGEIRRYAHTLSDMCSGNNNCYGNEARPSACWDGSKIAFASSWGYDAKNTTAVIYPMASTGNDLYVLVPNW